MCKFVEHSNFIIHKKKKLIDSKLKIEIFWNKTENY